MNPRDLMQGEKVVTGPIRMHPLYFAIEHFSLFILGIFTLGIGPYLVWKTTELYITNRRIVHRTGVLSKTQTDFNIRKINQVTARQDLNGRIFGYGYLDVVENDQLGLSFGPIPKVALMTSRTLLQEQAYADGRPA